MDNRKNQNPDSFDDSVYGTGSTEPPRNNGILVTLLLILVICLSGAVSALGFMNVRLFQELARQSQETTAPLSFFDESPQYSDPTETGAAAAAATIPRNHNSLGIAGEEVSPFYHRYYQFPDGLYITDVAPYSDAEILGLQPGDVLISFNGVPVTDPASLETLLKNYSAGDLVELEVYRGGRRITLQLTQE